jgi:DNA-binding CsgD family transcriptional regulator
VRNHLSSVYRKLGVCSRAQAIVKAGALGESGTG